MPDTGRMYLCARSHEQVVVCRRCDRGQVYCPSGCAALVNDRGRVNLSPAQTGYRMSAGVSWTLMLLMTLSVGLPVPPAAGVSSKTVQTLPG